MTTILLGMQGLKALLTTLIISLPAFYNVGALLMLVFFMYSYVAVLLFGTIQAQAAITNHANFSNFGEHWSALLACSRSRDSPNASTHCLCANTVACLNVILLYRNSQRTMSVPVPPAV